MIKVFILDAADADRHETARMLLRWKYEEIWGRELPEISISPKGKPYFPDGPGHFSISYSQNVCCCALSDSPVGLDMELRRPVKQQTAQNVLAAREWMTYSVHPDPVICFLHYWTLKEAYCKFTGEGLGGIKLRETVFHLGGMHPILLNREDLHFRTVKTDFFGRDAVISICTDRYQSPEIHSVSL